MIDPFLVVGLSVLIALGIVAAAVPKVRNAALVGLGAAVAFLGLRGLDRLFMGRRQEPLPPKPDKDAAREDAAAEAAAVRDALQEATDAAPVRDTPPDLDALAERANARMEER